jgi:hypothetical protein
MVKLFSTIAEGWGVLAALTPDALSQLREKQRCGELDQGIFDELRQRSLLGNADKSSNGMRMLARRTIFCKPS